MKTPAPLKTAVILLLLSMPAFAQEAKPDAANPAGAEQMQKTAEWLAKSFQGQATPEGAEMLIAIAKGSQLGPGEGWFHPGQTRYGWKWLSERHGGNLFTAIPKDKFKGPEATFAALDKK
ncbi:MAG: hypothetical protein K8R36_06760 [Planctomycetales bacterium]|nr:hypothetical protein [Planctomycetales bacterium]